MSSPGIDKWVEKDPKSWSKLIETKKTKMGFEEFKKQFKKQAKQKGKYRAVKQMSDQQLKTIFLASGLTKRFIGGSGGTPKKPVKTLKPKKIRVKRKGKTYIRTIQPRYKPTDLFALKITAKLPVRSKEYNQNIKNIMDSTGRTRQAVTKKIQRLRRQL